MTPAPPRFPFFRFFPLSWCGSARPDPDAPCYSRLPCSIMGEGNLSGVSLLCYKGRPRCQDPSTTHRGPSSRLIGMRGLAIAPMEPSEAKSVSAGFRGPFGRADRHGRTLGRRSRCGVGGDQGRGRAEESPLAGVGAVGDGRADPWRGRAGPSWTEHRRCHADSSRRNDAGSTPSSADSTSRQRPTCGSSPSCSPASRESSW